jgi:hypothetical protein
MDRDNCLVDAAGSLTARHIPTGINRGLWSCITSLACALPFRLTAIYDCILAERMYRAAGRFGFIPFVE